jgi:hypothetical protein
MPTPGSLVTLLVSRAAIIPRLGRRLRLKSAVLTKRTPTQERTEAGAGGDGTIGQSKADAVESRGVETEGRRAMMKRRTRAGGVSKECPSRRGITEEADQAAELLEEGEAPTHP